MQTEPMNVEVPRATLQEKPILQNLMELYQYDFTEIEGTDVGASGLFGYSYLDHYWTDPGRYPFLVKVDGKVAGFVLVNRHSYLSSNDETMAIAEFFIMRKYRRRGVGEQVATRVFDLFPGKWEVQQTEQNAGGRAFWRKVIGRYTAGRFEETLLTDGKGQSNLSTRVIGARQTLDSRCREEGWS